MKKEPDSQRRKPESIYYFHVKPECMISYSLTWIRTSVEISLLRCDAMTLRNEFSSAQTRPSVTVTVYFWHIMSRFLECQNLL